MQTPPLYSLLGKSFQPMKL
uniref:Uncharacterized protein n=1 Tax=Anguilla anguilla TaxID=7936 RepID=A0A0E9UMW7_ANGAN